MYLNPAVNESCWSQPKLFVSSFGSPGLGCCHSCPFQVWFILHPMHSALPSTSPRALEYFNVTGLLMYEGKWDQWMEQGAGTALQFVYMGQALRTAELTQTQRHSPSVLFHSSRNRRKAEGPHICFSWIMSPPGLAQPHTYTIIYTPSHLQPSTAFATIGWKTPTIDFCLNRGILTAAVQDTTQKIAPACWQLGQAALTLQSDYWSSLVPGKITSSSHTNSLRLLPMQL